METVTTHSFELTYEELLKIIEIYVLEQDPAMNTFMSRLKKEKSIHRDNMSISPSSRIYLRISKKA